VRGREISREPDDIVREIHLAAQHGCKEITLLGQNVNSYRYHISDDMTLDFPGLLERVVEQTGDIEWIRFLTSHPKDFSKQLITLIKEEQKLCKNIHLPVQSGSTSVLRAMNRRYDRDHYLELIDTIKREIPGVTLSTDVLVGFPGETEADFEETLDLMEKVRFSDAFTYKYNPRAGTKAYSVDASPVPEETKSARLETLIELQRSISHQEKQTRLGSTVQVLVEDISKKSDNEVLGRSEGNDMVVFPGNADMIGRFYRVRLQSLFGNTFKGEVV
jgi:tRNA-2-methylthio-N6-dimethylallyladenosine synthase